MLSEKIVWTKHVDFSLGYNSYIYVFPYESHLSYYQQKKCFSGRHALYNLTILCWVRIDKVPYFENMFLVENVTDRSTQISKNYFLVGLLLQKRFKQLHCFYRYEFVKNCHKIFFSGSPVFSPQKCDC